MAGPWHLGFESEDRLELFGRSEATLRKAVRVLARVAGKDTLLFCIVDDHVHVVVFCEKENAGRIARAILLALRPLASVPFRPHAYVKKVESRSHLTQLVRYCLDQPVHHDLKVHPALWSGSCLQDLAGARVVGALGKSLWTVLPQRSLLDVLPLVGLDASEIVPAADKKLRSAGAARLASAAAAALAADPELKGHRAEVEQARSAVSILGRGAGVATREIASALGVTLRTVQRLSLVAPDRSLLRAVRIRISLEEAAANAIRPAK